MAEQTGFEQAMTRILSYSPSIEAYVAVTGRGGAVTYYDISPDISSCKVERKSDGVSTFSIQLQNKQGKYNNVFEPMDRITIYATKRGDKFQLLTGYINSVTRFTLYPQDFTMTGSCSLYRLQNLYWDPGLEESYRLIATEDETSISANWTNYTSLIYKLVCIVGGMPGNLKVSAVPSQVMDWARELYAANKADADAMQSDIMAFYDMLGTTNTQIASGTVEVVNSRGGVIRVRGSFGDGASYHQAQGNGSNCGATSFTVSLNMMLGLKGADAYDNVQVWSSPSFGSDSTYAVPSKGTSFLASQNLSSVIEFYEPAGGDFSQASQLREELQAGHLVVISSGYGAKFLRNDGSYSTYPDGHFIMFYAYDGKSYYCNDSSRSADLGAGVAYSEAALQDWLNARPWHATAIMARRTERKER